MKCIALTGGIACGKSTLAGMLADRGCDVLDTDAVVHALEAPGGAGVEPIVAAFGAAARAADGGIARAWLGRVVCADPAARMRLNAIVHPLVRSVLERWRSEPCERLRVAVVPLLFEVGWDAGWDAVVCVACRPGEQMRRLLARGLPEDEARAWMAAQMPLDEKMRRADRVVWNDADPAALRREAERLIEEWSA